MDKSVSCHNLTSKFHAVASNKKWLFINSHLSIPIIAIDLEVLNYHKLTKLGLKIPSKLISISEKMKKLKTVFPSQGFQIRSATCIRADQKPLDFGKMKNKPIGLLL